jgi:hypothetical protein
MKKQQVLKQIESIKEHLKSIDSSLFVCGEEGKLHFLNLFCESWIYPELEFIKTEVLK